MRPNVQKPFPLCQSLRKNYTAGPSNLAIPIASSGKHKQTRTKVYSSTVFPTVPLEKKTAAVGPGEKRPCWKITVEINKAIFCWVSSWHWGYLLWGAEDRLVPYVGRQYCLAYLIYLWKISSRQSSSARSQTVQEIHPAYCLVLRTRTSMVVKLYLQSKYIFVRFSIFLSYAITFCVGSWRICTSLSFTKLNVSLCNDLGLIRHFYFSGYWFTP